MVDESEWAAALRLCLNPIQSAEDAELLLRSERPGLRWIAFLVRLRCAPSLDERRLLVERMVADRFEATAESGQAQGAKKASEAASSGGLPVSQKTTVDDPALWDAQKALKTCGKSTRYLTIGVWATSGCRTGSDFYAEATTYGYADSTTSPKEPTKTEGKDVD